MPPAMELQTEAVSLAEGLSLTTQLTTHAVMDVRWEATSLTETAKVSSCTLKPNCLPVQPAPHVWTASPLQARALSAVQAFSSTTNVASINAPLRLLPTHKISFDIDF